MSELLRELRRMRWGYGIAFFVGIPFFGLLKDGLHEALGGAVVGGIFLLWMTLLWVGLEADHWIGKAALVFAISLCVVLVGLVISAIVAAAAQYLSVGALIGLFVVGSTAITTALWEGI